MTINLADNDPRISYSVAQGVTQTSFAVPFEFFADADLNVYVDGTLKTLTTDYTVTGGDGSTGTVSISVTGATGGSTVVITRDIALERTTDFPTSGPFDVVSLNSELDKQIAMIADLKDKADRALQLTDFDADVSLVLPDVDTRKGKTLAFNASTGAVEAGPSITDVQTVSAASADIATLADIEDGTDATDAIQTVAGIAANVTTVAGVAANVSTVAGISSDVTAVAADATDIGTVSTNIANVNTVAGISANVTTVAGISSAVSTVAADSADIQAVAADATDIGTVATNIANINTVAGQTTNLQNVTDNLTAIQNAASNASAAAASQVAAAASAASAASAFDNFDDTYLGAKASDPTVDNDGDPLTQGDLYFNTTANEMRVYDGGSWIAASSAGGASLLMYEYTATSGQTTFSGSDDNANTLSYTIDNIIVTLNGVVLDPSDYTATNGTSIVLGTGAALNDELNVVAFKSFTTADMVSATNGGTFGNDITINGDLTVDTDTLYVDSANNLVGIGTTSPVRTLSVDTTSQLAMRLDSSNTANFIEMADANGSIRFGTQSTGEMTFYTGGDASHAGESEAMRIDSSGNLLVGKTSVGVANVGAELRDGVSDYSVTGVSSSQAAALFGRNTDDGSLVVFRQDNTTEGSISVSGTTVSYNGGHLARWSRLADDSKDTSIVKGTVMTNLDEMVEWDDEANEQLNKMAVSSVEGDANVAGVFVNWDDDDNWNDMNIAMTGDMVIRIAQGTTVARGDLLMSAGDGTAKPQGDDIVRSKTIAKVTSTHVSHTYDDGSYLVPCVLMAC